MQCLRGLSQILHFDQIELRRPELTANTVSSPQEIQQKALSFGKTNLLGPQKCHDPLQHSAFEQKQQWDDQTSRRQPAAGRGSAKECTFQMSAMASGVSAIIPCSVRYNCVVHSPKQKLATTLSSSNCPGPLWRPGSVPCAPHKEAFTHIASTPLLMLKVTALCQN